MFDFLKKDKNREVLAAPVKGRTVPSSAINDPTFSQEMLGKGLAIQPEEGKICSPVDGTIAVVIDTKHAVSVTSKQGAEVLIHVGLNTVALKGKYFTSHVTMGDEVKKGDLLLEFDMEALKAEGYDVITPIIVCNSDAYKDINRYIDKNVEKGDTVIELIK